MEEIKEYWDEAEQKLKAHYFLKDGKLHGLLQRWYKNGQKRAESNCVNDKFHGLCQYWYENGQKWKESWYINGVRYESEEEYEESRIVNKDW